jgi:cell division initiation protein
MKLTPIDIRKQEFKKVLRGYDPVEVETFMEMLANEFESLLRDHREMRERVIDSEAQLKDYRQIEKALQQTLLQAQEATNRTLEAARREAEMMIREAERTAAELVEQAGSDLTRTRNDLSELQGRREALLGRLRMLLQAELDILGAQGGASIDRTGMAPADELPVDDILNVIDHERTADTE